ncbi:hypothetical protein [Alysiella crassa]|uniref:hypothetical protein n=1 Tax=Alysiella crassa TaxID=153491 RepID=UPI0012EBA721|nr:hypothetical protein [Alysiella crassa]
MAQFQQSRCDVCDKKDDKKERFGVSGCLKVIPQHNHKMLSEMAELSVTCPLPRWRGRVRVGVEIQRATLTLALSRQTGEGTDCSKHFLLHIQFHFKIRLAIV